MMASKIIDSFVKKSNYIPDNPFGEMRTFAIEHSVPIVSDEVLNFIIFMIKSNKPKKILELGTAIGYSTAFFAINSEADITTVELDETMYELARENIAKHHLSHRIELHLGDAEHKLDEFIELGNTYDFIFIDAAKGQYLKYFKKSEKMISEGGIILCDNILYRGLVAGARSNRRNRTISARMNEFIDYVRFNEDFTTSFISAGDGLVMSLKNVKTKGK